MTDANTTKDELPKTVEYVQLGKSGLRVSKVSSDEQRQVARPLIGPLQVILGCMS